MGRGLWALQIEGMEVGGFSVTKVSGSSAGMVKGKEIKVRLQVGSLRKAEGLK